MTKALHRKRPALIPMLDSVVQRYLEDGSSSSSRVSSWALRERFLYLALRRWLPERPLFRTLCVALIILGFGLTAVINGNEADFEFVNTAVSILSFACVLLVCEMLVPLVDRLAPGTASRSRSGRGLVGAVLVLSVVSGVLAVRHAFEIADGGLLIR